MPTSTATAVRVADPPSPFVSILQREQRRRGMSDAAFARFMGVSPSCWCLTQAGRALGSRLILRVFATFSHTPHGKGRECVACDLSTALGQSQPVGRLSTDSRVLPFSGAIAHS